MKSTAGRFEEGLTIRNKRAALSLDARFGNLTDEMTFDTLLKLWTEAVDG